MLAGDLFSKKLVELAHNVSKHCIEWNSHRNRRGLVWFANPLPDNRYIYFPTHLHFLSEAENLSNIWRGGDCNQSTDKSSCLETNDNWWMGIQMSPTEMLMTVDIWLLYTSDDSNWRADESWCVMTWTTVMSTPLTYCTVIPQEGILIKHSSVLNTSLLVSVSSARILAQNWGCWSNSF